MSAKCSASVIHWHLCFIDSILRMFLSFKINTHFLLMIKRNQVESMLCLLLYLTQFMRFLINRTLTITQAINVQFVALCALQCLFLILLVPCLFDPSGQFILLFSNLLLFCRLVFFSFTSDLLDKTNLIRFHSYW